MTDAEKKAKKKYLDKGKRMTVDFYPSEADLIEQIDKQPNKQGYIKNLIRSDIGNGIFLIYKDSMDDACTIEGYIIGTSEDADRYCDELNKGHQYEWEDFDWMKIDNLNK